MTLRSKTMLLLSGVLVTLLTAPIGADAQTPIGGDQRPFRFELAQADGPRGLAVEGYVYNSQPWHITNVRVRVESVDANGMVAASASGWVVGDVNAGGRAYFYVPISSPAPTYRATVQSFDKVAVEPPRFEAP